MLIGIQSEVASSTSAIPRSPVAVLPVDVGQAPVVMDSTFLRCRHPMALRDDSSLKYDQDSDVEEITPPSFDPD